MEVTEGMRCVATVAQLGGTDPNNANVAVVKFTVRHAGHYCVAVKVGSTSTVYSHFKVPKKKFKLARCRQFLISKLACR